MKKLLAATAVLGFALSAQVAIAAPWHWPSPPKLPVKIDRCANVLVPPGFVCTIDKAGNVVIKEWTPPPSPQQVGRALRNLFGL